jgi:uncharacterized protein (TIGR00288 family)
MAPLQKQYNRVAIFIDAENLVIEADKAGLQVTLHPVMDRIREEGQIIFARAYGDWMNSQINRHVNDFRSNIVEFTMLSTDKCGKNTADISLAVDALEMALLPSAPDVIVIIAGDRDFVPLVQKIRRYGKAVIGIGIKGSSSRELAQACDMFLFLDDILYDEFMEDMPEIAVNIEEVKSNEVILTDNKQEFSPENDKKSVNDSQEIILPSLPSETLKAFGLLSRAVSIIARQGLPALGSNTRMYMQQLDSTFDPFRFGYTTFKEFASAAQGEGFVKIILQPEGDFRFDCDFQASTEFLSKINSLPDEKDLSLLFETPMEARNSYKQILQKKKHVELLSWEHRKLLMNYLWNKFDQSIATGLSIEQICDLLKTHSYEKQLRIQDRLIDTLVRSLNIAKCFKDDTDSGYQYDSITPLQPAVTCEEAIFLVHYTYINGIRMAVPNVPLKTEGIASLLFDNVTEESCEEARKIITKVEGWPEGGTSSMQEALMKFKVKES